jgi:hypothetical protein
MVLITYIVYQSETIKMNGIKFNIDIYYISVKA